MKAEKPKLQSRVAQLRDRAGLTQLQLSQQVGVTETTIANWERGRSGLDWFERVMRLCQALDCRPEDLIEFSQPGEVPLSFREICQLVATEVMSFTEIRQLIETEEMTFSQIRQLIDANKSEETERLLGDEIDEHIVANPS